MITDSFTAPITTPGNILTIDRTTKILYLQNNDLTNFMVFGFTSSLSLLTGVKIVAGDIMPVPLDGNETPLYVLADTAEITLGVFLKG